MCVSGTHPLVVVILFLLSVDEILPCFSEPKIEIILVEVHLPVLVSFLEFCDRDLLPFVEIGSVTEPTSVLVFVLGGGPSVVLPVRPTPRHTVHIEDGVGVDYGDDGHQDQTSCHSNEHV